MECPHCKKPIKLPAHATGNMEAFGRPVLVNTECCHKPVQCYPRTVYSAHEYLGNKTEDDWGSPIKR